MERTLSKPAKKAAQAAPAPKPALRHWLIAEPGQPAREIVSAVHPCDLPAPDIAPGGANVPLYAGSRDHVVAIAAAPDDPRVLRHRGVTLDA